MCGSWYSALDRSVATGKVFVDPSYLFFLSVSDAGNRGNHIRGGPLEIPGGRGGGGGGGKIPPKKFVQRKMPGKKIRAAITSEKKKSCKQTAKCK